MLPYNKNNVSSGDYRGSKVVLQERVIEGLQNYDLFNSDLQLVYNSPKNIVITNINGTKVILPNANNLINGWCVFIINNDENNNLDVCLYSEDKEKPLFNQVESGKMIQCLLLDNSTASGKWKLITTGEFGNTELESKYTTNVYDKINIKYTQLPSGNFYSEILSEVPASTPIKSIYIKPIEKFLGTEVYISIGTEEEPNKFYNNVLISSDVSNDNYIKDLFEEILSTTENKNLIINFYTKIDEKNEWTKITTNVESNIKNSLYENGIYVLITDEQQILTSVDGENFITHTIEDFNFSPKSFYYENGYFYIAGIKNQKLTIAKTNDFEEYNFLEINKDITIEPLYLLKFKNDYIIINQGEIYNSKNIESEDSWTFIENSAITDILNVSYNNDLLVISCKNFYFTSSDGINFSQNSSNSECYFYANNNWISFYKNSLDNSTIKISNDFSDWKQKEINTLNINDITFINNTWFIFTESYQYPDECLTISKDLFNTIKRININLEETACTACGVPTKTIIAGFNGNASYSSGNDFYALTSGELEVIVEKVKEINPQTIKNPIINTNVPIGTIFNYPFSDIPDGYARLDGGILENVNIIIPDFIEKLEKTKNAGYDNILISNEMYQKKTDEEKNNCGSFSWVDDSRKSSLRFPKINCFIRGIGNFNSISDLSQVGTYYPDTIRPITGTLAMGGVNGGSLAYQTTGAFIKGDYRIGPGGGQDGSAWDADTSRFKFDSSNLGSSYNGTETTPKYVKYPYIICIYNSAQQTATINLESVSNLLRKNQEILNESYEQLTRIQGEKSNINRQCIITAPNSNYVRVINGLNVTCDQFIYATNAQGFVNGIQFDIPIVTDLALSYILPTNYNGSLFLEKNIETGEINLNVCEKWIESINKPNNLSVGDIWYDLRNEKLYKYSSDNQIEKVYAVKIADFITSSTTVTSFNILPLRYNSFYNSFPDYNSAISRTWGVEYTSQQNGWIDVAILCYNSQAYLTINGIQQTLGGFDNNDSHGDSIMLPISKGDTYLLSGNYQKISRYVFIPCKGEMIK